MRFLPCLLVIAAAALAGCTGEDRACSEMSFPAPPSDVDNPVFVASPCSAENADGTRERPYTSIGDALANAPSGATILVAEETSYDEQLVIDKPVHLLASAPNIAALDANVTVRPKTGPGVLVSPGVEDVLVRGLVIERAKGAGVWVRGGTATLDGVMVHDTERDGDGHFGYGILASEGATCNMVRTSVDGTPAVGIYFDASTGSLDTVDVQNATGHGAIRLEGATETVVIRNASISQSTEVGILVANSKARIEDSLIVGALLGAGGADGIVVTRRKGPDGAYLQSAHADIKLTTVTQSARVGVLFSDGATGSLVDSTVGYCGTNSGWGAGVWIQSGAGGKDGILVSHNHIQSNQFLGIGVTSGASATILDNTGIDSTQGGLVVEGDDYIDVGDGIGVFNGALAHIEESSIGSHYRFGVIFDDAAAGSTFKSNHVHDNGMFGLVVQHPNSGIPPFADNDYENNSFGPTSILGPNEPPFPVHTADFSIP